MHLATGGSRGLLVRVERAGLEDRVGFMRLGDLAETECVGVETAFAGAVGQLLLAAIVGLSTTATRSDAGFYAVGRRSSKLPT
jgi:hypothetical protein